MRGVWEMTAEGQVKQGNMCLALGGPGVVAMDCQEAAAVGAGSFFPVAVPKSDPQAAAGVHSLGKLVRASVARQNKLLATLSSLTPKLATCKTNVSLMGSGKQATSAVAFSSNHAVGGTRAHSRQDWSAIWGGPLPTFTVDRRVCQSLGCSSQGNKFMQLAAASELPLSGSAPLMFFEWRGNWTYLSFRSAGVRKFQAATCNG